jgi:hypothetical protein
MPGLFSNPRKSGQLVSLVRSLMSAYPIQHYGSIQAEISEALQELALKSKPISSRQNETREHR